jgi:hypothetical protein
MVSKICSVCHVDKPFLEYYKQPHGKFGFTSRCKPCHQASNRRWASKNKVKINQLANKNRNKNPERARIACRKWRLKNKPYDAMRQQERRAMQRNQMPSWANREKIKAIYEHCPQGYHVDHIVPLRGKTVSGLHVETNLQYLPALENIRKKNYYADNLV